MTELKDWLNSINFNKENLIEEDPSEIKNYPPYIINRCLSGHLDCIMFANEMNKYSFLDATPILVSVSLTFKKSSGSFKVTSTIWSCDHCTVGSVVVISILQFQVVV